MSRGSSPTVSICMSAYNTADYVAQALQSTLDQSLDDIEIVVLDNASTDGTSARIEAFADPRIRLLRVDENLGAAGGRRHTIEHARGDWIAVLDSDDWMDPNRLERLVALGDAVGADVVADDLHLIDDGDTEPWGTLFTSGGPGLADVTVVDAATFVRSDRWLEPGLRLGLVKPLFRRSFIGDDPTLLPDPTLQVVHDFWWVFEALMAGATMVLSPTPGYYYRARAGQLVASGHELHTLEQQIARARRALGRPEVVADHELVDALDGSLERWVKAQDYMVFLHALRTRHVGSALGQAARRPRVVSTLVRNAPGWVTRRLGRDDFADHLTHRY